MVSQKDKEKGKGKKKGGKHLKVFFLNNLKVKGFLEFSEF